MTLHNFFSWSKSRDETFRECPRQYFFHYYGSWGGWENNAPDRVREAYILKKLKSRHIWVGETVHHFIEKMIKQYPASQDIKLEEFSHKMTEQMRNEFKASRNGDYRKFPSKVLGLYEHEYGQNISDEKWKEMHALALRCLTQFANVLFPELVQPVDPEYWQIIEHLLTFEVDQTPVYVKIDFCYKNNEGVSILDWKTGKSEDVDSDIQLSCYGLFAHQHFNIPIDKIRMMECNVNTGKNKESSLIPAKIDFIKHYIKNSIGRMRQMLVDVSRNTTTEEDFPFTDNERTCRFCNFQKICPKFS